MYPSLPYDLFVLASAFGGLYLYAASGNHVIAESGFQFNVMTQILRTAVFHSLRHHESLSRYAWVMEITDPVATYVAVEREGTLLYSYGNEKKAGRIWICCERKEPWTGWMAGMETVFTV